MTDPDLPNQDGVGGEGGKKIKSKRQNSWKLLQRGSKHLWEARKPSEAAAPCSKCGVLALWSRKREVLFT
jgi:hypothetical protein